MVLQDLSINYSMKQEKPKLVANDVELFKEIPEKERAAFRRKVLQTPQLQGDAHVKFKSYPKEDKWDYKGHQLHWYASEQTQSPIAVIIFVHSLNSYGGFSGYYASQVTLKVPGVNFYTFDQLNFGKSESPSRGYVGQARGQAEQAEVFVDFVLSRFKNKPQVFLSGLSYGCTIGFQMCLRNPYKYDGAVFLAPGLRNNNEDIPYQKWLVRWIGWLFPRVCLPLGVANTKSNLRSAQKFYEQDSNFFRDGVVPGSIRNLLMSLDRAPTQYKNFKTPYLVVMGGKQKMTDLFAPVDLERESPSKDKTTLYLKDMWHSVISEPQIDDVIAHVVEWFKKRIQ